MESLKISVHKARDEDAAASQLINLDGLGEGHHATISGYECTLWVRTHKSARPPWLETFAELFSVSPQDLMPEAPTSVSGIAWIVTSTARLAISFGHSWMRLKRNEVDPSFGIRCVLNLCNADALRAIRRDRMTSEFVQVIEQSPEETGLYRFGVDTEADMLRGIRAGVDPTLGFGSTVSGSDSFQCVWDPTKSSIHQLLDAVVALSRLETYKKNFAWIGFISPIRGDADIQSLNDAAANDIGNATSSFLLNPPNFTQWQEYDYFLFGRRKKNQAREELKIDAWKSHLRGAKIKLGSATPSKVVADDLMNERIHAIDLTQPNRSTTWSVYDCLHGTFQALNGTYMLHEGSWYRLATDYVARVDAFLDLIEKDKAPYSLPLCAANEKEDDYNKRAAKSSSRRLRLFDRKIIMHGGGHSKFEFCDLLGEDISIYCVKRWASSAGISHLARQAVNTCKLIRSDENFCKKIERRLKGNHRGSWLKTRNRSLKPRVVLAVMGCKKIQDLPFFSRMTLCDAARQIQILGFAVSFDWI